MMVGESYAELTRRNADFAVGDIDWSDQGRSRVMLVNQGLLRLYGERNTGKFLGAEMIGPRAEHLGHLLAWARQSDLTVSEKCSNAHSITPSSRRAFAQPCAI